VFVEKIYYFVTCNIYVNFIVFTMSSVVCLLKIYYFVTCNIYVNVIVFTI
jgi:hypothetical protein